MSKNICGCGECEACRELTQRLKDNQTLEERAYDRHATRMISGEDDSPFDLSNDEFDAIFREE